MEKFIVAALVGLMAITPAFAWTDIRTQYQGSGLSIINDLSVVSGFDWSECDWEETAYIHEGIFNKGELLFVKEVKNPGEWVMQESKYVEGSGFTMMGKDVVWWTEDSTMEDGKMKWPTEASGYMAFQTATLLDEEEFYNKANDPTEDRPGEFSTGRFLKNWITNDDFTFVEGVSFGADLDCEPELPRDWDFPECGCPTCPC